MINPAIVENLKFKSFIVRDNAKAFSKSQEKYIKWKEAVERVGIYTNLTSTSIVGFNQAISQINDTIKEMELEKGQLMVDINNFEKVELSNERLMNNLLDRLMLIGINVDSYSSENINGVKIDDFSAFTNMTQDEFFEYMRANGGYYGVDQGCLDSQKFITKEFVERKIYKIRSKRRLFLLD